MLRGLAGIYLTSLQVGANVNGRGLLSSDAQWLGGGYFRHPRGGARFTIPGPESSTERASGLPSGVLPEPLVAALGNGGGSPPAIGGGTLTPVGGSGGTPAVGTPAVGGSGTPAVGGSGAPAVATVGTPPPVGGDALVGKGIDEQHHPGDMRRTAAAWVAKGGGLMLGGGDGIIPPVMGFQQGMGGNGGGGGMGCNTMMIDRRVVDRVGGGAWVSRDDANAVAAWAADMRGAPMMNGGGNILITDDMVTMTAHRGGGQHGMCGSGQGSNMGGGVMHSIGGHGGGMGGRVIDIDGTGMGGMPPTMPTMATKVFAVSGGQHGGFVDDSAQHAGMGSCGVRTVSSVAVDGCMPPMATHKGGDGTGGMAPMVAGRGGGMTMGGQPGMVVRCNNGTQPMVSAPSMMGGDMVVNGGSTGGGGKGMAMDVNVRACLPPPRPPIRPPPQYMLDQRPPFAKAPFQSPY